jgi:putative endonuclease
MEWHVYIVKCSDGSLYTGVALNVDDRVNRHNAGKGAKYTRSRKPVELVYTESVDSKGDALRREYEIKQLAVKEKHRLIEQFVK